MCIRTLRGDAAARRAGNEPLLQEVGLVDIANRVGFLADRGNQRIDSDRTAVELVEGPEPGSSADAVAGRGRQTGRDLTLISVMATNEVF